MQQTGRESGPQRELLAQQFRDLWAVVFPALTHALVFTRPKNPPASKPHALPEKAALELTIGLTFKLVAW